VFSHLITDIYAVDADFTFSGFLNKAEKKGATLSEDTEPTAIKSAFIEEVKD